MAEYRGLSKEEVKLLSRLEYEGKNIVNRQYILSLLNNDIKKTSNILYTLVKKNRIKRLKRSKFIIVPLKAPNMMWGENQYVIAGEYMEGKEYYIGYFSAYNTYGFTDQVPQTMYVLNTYFSGTKTINNLQFKFIKVSKSKIYGFRNMEINGKKIRISDKERTLVDLMFNPDAVGGIESAADILRNNIDKIELKKLIKYAAMFPDRGTIKRIGYVLSDAGIGKSSLAVLKNRAKGGSLIKFSKNGSRKGVINTEWGLIINDSN